jgi:hypothetical protein
VQCRHTECGSQSRRVRSSWPAVRGRVENGQRSSNPVACAPRHQFAHSTAPKWRRLTASSALLQEHSRSDHGQDLPQVRSGVLHDKLRRHAEGSMSMTAALCVRRCFHFSLQALNCVPCFSSAQCCLTPRSLLQVVCHGLDMLICCFIQKFLAHRLSQRLEVKLSSRPEIVYPRFVGYFAQASLCVMLNLRGTSTTRKLTLWGHIA